MGIATQLARHARNVEHADILAAATGYTPPARTEWDYVLPASHDSRDHRHLAIGLLLERDGPDCYLCRQPFSALPNIEHIIPIRHGGENAPHNTALACPDCNSSKSDSYVSITITTRRPIYHRI